MPASVCFWNRERLSMPSAWSTLPGVLNSLLLVALALSGLGCGQVAGPPPAPSANASPRDSMTAGDPQPPPSAGHKFLETWDAVFQRDSKIGFSHTVMEKVSRQGETLVKANSWMETEVVRFEQVAKSQMHVESWESESGQVRSFRVETRAGPTPITVQGESRDGELSLVVSTKGGQVRRTMPWKPSHGGFFAVEQSLAGQPMQPAEKRELTFLMPWLTGVELVTSKLTAEAVEPVALVNTTEQLLKITQTIQLGGVTIDCICWTDEHGQILKNTIPQLQQTIIRTTREVAQAPGAAGDYDLGKDSVVRISAPLPHPHQLTKAVYEIAVPHADVAQLFVSGASQIVEPLDQHTARLTVLAVRPHSPTTAVVEAPAGPGDSEPNSMIEADDPQIEKLAREAVGTQTGAWEKCVALEKWVHAAIRRKNFGQAFATAADVARSLEGDCTEHAVLLAALCRAQAIPARVVVGLVYSPLDQGFAFHMWNEAWVEGRWIPLDATLGQGGIGAAHVKISHSNLGGEGTDVALLSVIPVINQLKIRVLEYEPR